MTTEFKTPENYKPMPYRFLTQEGAMKAMRKSDFSEALTVADKGYEQAPFEIGLITHPSAKEKPCS